ncbi:hypothetical protein VQ643_14850 [Pseudomonas sp. F1_0610]|uniref:hypothetical protein n=1 Tax=Pseudomonas sp. F1_0610 TaxID=3114284 RepID=UPI0039C288AC
MQINRFLKLFFIGLCGFLLSACSLYLTEKQQYIDRDNDDTIENLKWFPAVMVCVNREIPHAKAVLAEYKNLPQYYNYNFYTESHIYNRCIIEMGSYNFRDGVDRYFHRIYYRRLNLFPVEWPEGYNPDNLGFNLMR